MAIRITTEAARQMYARSKHLFFYCKSGGCNGLEYMLETVDNAPENVDTQKLENGVFVHTCNQSMLYLLGTKIDWKADTMGARFTFENPNANSMCGCGATFST
jgi:iron-sulfur cluster assembly accessory protein